MDTATTIGKRIRLVRERRGWTQAQLADASEVGAEQICRYEAGVSEPRVETLTKLAKALDVALDALV
jgi:transcriptional regulator with XRE-family HTH domain